MQFHYHILSELDLIIENYKGDFSYSDIFDCKKAEAMNPDFRSHYNVLADIRNGSITMTKRDIGDMPFYLEDNVSLHAERQSAILTSLPGQVVFGTLLQIHNVRTSKIMPEVFSSLASALSWLGIDHKNYLMIEGLLLELTEAG